MTTGARLSRGELPRLRAEGTVAVPAVEPSSTGIVHLGIGAFHRAHQAVFTEDAAAATGEAQWGICGVTQRSNAVIDQLRPQQCLYSVLTRDRAESSARLVGSIREVLSGPDETDVVVNRIADQAVRVITLTVTEKGYRQALDGGVDLSDPLIRSDLDGQPPRTAIGLLVRGLERRMLSSGAGLSVLPCDNLVAGGEVVRGLVLSFCSALRRGDRLGAWISDHVTFPSAVVDRIVPATEEADRAEVTRLLGVDDQAVVVAEPFRQWVIEDAFVAGRPAWERAGATLTANVAPYEAIKLRLLNGAHSLLAYTGALAGYQTIAQAVADQRLAEAAERLMAEDVVPTLAIPRDFDVSDYCAQVLARFANPVLRHRTLQVAMDGSQKIPVRLLGTIKDRLATGAEPYWATHAVAAWMAFVTRRSDDKGRTFSIEDPLSAELHAAVAGVDETTAIVDALLGIRQIFPDDLAENPVFRGLLIDRLAHFR